MSQGIRLILRIEPAGVDLVVDPSLHVRGEAVTDHQDRGLAGVAHRLEGRVVDARIRLGVADLVTDDHDLEEPAEARVIKPGALNFGSSHARLRGRLIHALTSVTLPRELAAHVLVEPTQSELQYTPYIHTLLSHVSQ